MEWVLLAVKAALEAHAVAEVSERVAAFVSRWCHGRRLAEVQEFLERIACQDRASIDDLIETHEEAHGAVDPAVRAELVRVLENLTRGARFLSKNGGPRSAFLRNESLILQIVRGCGVKRRSGEPAAEGSDWILDRFLGMGAFGEVWSARNPGHPEQRAFKYFTDERAREWIRREQESLYKVRERLCGVPNIVEFKDIAVGATETPYIVLEYVAGGSLQDWIESPDRPPLDKHELMRGIATGLAHAHEIGIFHRDIKPANIVLTDDPRPIPKITDFGLATVVESMASSLATTAASMAQFVGTWMYLPPEADSMARRPDPGRDDVFAFGVCWYQVLVEAIERPPYDYESRLRGAGVDSYTIDMVSRCLARPDRRFQDATRLLEAMTDVVPPVRPSGDGLDVQHLVREYLAARSV